MANKYGFIPPQLRDTDFYFGGQTKLGQEVLCPTGQWDAYLPEKEYQNRNGLETSNCTVFGSLNAIEVLFKRLFNKEDNYSERYIGVLAKTSPQGNSVSLVMDTIRHKGLIPENLLPFSENINEWAEYYFPNPMTQDFLLLGQNWLLLYGIGHEWVLTSFSGKDRTDKMKEALKYSPLGVSVSAWHGPNDKGLYYKPYGEPDNHWCMVYGYEDGKFWRVFDHYDNTHKKLEWNYLFVWAMRYSLWRKFMTPEGKKTLIQNVSAVLDIIKRKLLEISAQIKGRLGNYWKQIIK